MANTEQIARAINAVAKADTGQLAAYIALGKAISGIVGQPGVDNENAAVRRVLHLQQTDLAAELATQLAGSSLLLACQLAREEDYVTEVGATSVKAARSAIAARNKAAKPKVQKTENEDENIAVDDRIDRPESDDAVIQLEQVVEKERARARRAESDLFDVVAERDKLRKRVAELEARLARSAAQTESTPVEEDVPLQDSETARIADVRTGASNYDKLPWILPLNDNHAWSTWLALHTGDCRYTVHEKDDGFYAAHDALGMSCGPFLSARAAVAGVLDQGLVVAVNDVKAHQRRLREITGDTKARVVRKGGKFEFTVDGVVHESDNVVHALAVLESRRSFALRGEGAGAS